MIILSLVTKWFTRVGSYVYSRTVELLGSVESWNFSCTYIFVHGSSTTDLEQSEQLEYSRILNTHGTVVGGNYTGQKHRLMLISSISAQKLLKSITHHVSKAFTDTLYFRSRGTAIHNKQ